jgi:hypothetical protein
MGRTSRANPEAFAARAIATAAPGWDWAPIRVTMVLSRAWKGHGDFPARHEAAADVAVARTHRGRAARSAIRPRVGRLGRHCNLTDSATKRPLRPGRKLGPERCERPAPARSAISPRLGKRSEIGSFRIVLFRSIRPQKRPAGGGCRALSQTTMRPPQRALRDATVTGDGGLGATRGQTYRFGPARLRCARAAVMRLIPESPGIGRCPDDFGSSRSDRFGHKNVLPAAAVPRCRPVRGCRCAHGGRRRLSRTAARAHMGRLTVLGPHVSDSDVPERR